MTANRARFRVVNRSFSNTLPITIPDEGAANPYPSTLRVGGLRAGRILDVNVTLLGFSHDIPSEVQAILVAPNGRTSVVLMSDVSDGSTVTNLTLVVDDQAAFLPFDTAPLVSGTFKPTTPGSAPRPETATLAAFNGLNPNGTWRLYIADLIGGDEGSLTAWSLTIRARVQIPHRHRRRSNRRQRPARRAKR